MTERIIASRTWSVIIVVASLGVLAACGSGGGGGQADAGGGEDVTVGDPGSEVLPGTVFRLTGTVREETTAGSAASPLEGARVRATVDLDNDGQIGAGEAVEALSGPGGSFQADVPAPAGHKARVVLTISKEGLSSFHRTFELESGGQARVDATLVPLKTLQCQGSTCRLDQGALELTGLPEGFQGRARVFNPVTEADRFPGAFADSEGNLLVSSVFSLVELTDDSGNPVRTLAQAATLRMKVPRDTWATMSDLTPGTDRIEVPLYSFDEAAGEWNRDGTGYLEDGEGRVLAESDLAGVRNGSFAGVLYAAGDVDHFSYWNVDWPIETHACMKGRVVAASGAVVTGATVSVSGVTYTGASTLQVTGAAGSFCVDVMRSEAPGEDVDRDGIPGETQQVTALVSHQGKFYRFGPYDAPQQNASCAQGGCLDLGDLGLTSEREIQISKCTVHGHVFDLKGQPVAGAWVYAWDETLPEGALETVCFEGDPTTFCTFAGTTGTDGAYEVTTAFLGSLRLYAYWSSETAKRTETWWGSRTLDRCPSGNTEITLDEGSIFYELQVSWNQSQIAWTPPIPVQYLWVQDAMGNIRWFIASETSFTPPVAYGQVPAGAEQVMPPHGAPPSAMQSQDMILVSGNGSDPSGATYGATGQFSVP